MYCDVEKSYYIYNYNAYHEYECYVYNIVSIISYISYDKTFEITIANRLNEQNRQRELLLVSETM